MRVSEWRRGREEGKEGREGEGRKIGRIRAENPPTSQFWICYDGIITVPVLQRDEIDQTNGIETISTLYYSFLYANFFPNTSHCQGSTIV